MAPLPFIGGRVRLVALPLLVTFAAVVSAVVGTVTAAQDQARPTFRTSATVVTLTAVVTDREGKPVSGLGAADFELFNEGRRQHIVVFDAISRPAGKPRDPLRDDWIPVADVASNAPAPASGRAFVFVVDPSFIQIVLYQRVLTKLFSLLTPDDRVAVVFPRRSDLSVDFTSDPVRVSRAIDRLTDAAVGNDFRTTFMALENAMVSLETVPLARKAIVWVSGGFNVKLLPTGRDGRDPFVLANPLRYARDQGIAREAIELFNKGERLGIPIYTIDPFGLYPEATTRTELLKTASVATGGTSYVNRAFIVDAAQELMASNDHFYVLGFAPDPFKSDGKFRQIRLRVAGRPDLSVRTRAGYVAKAPPPTYADPTEGLRAELAADRPLDQLGMRAFAVPLGPGPSRRTSLLLTTSVEYPPSDTSQRRDDVLTLLVLALDPDARILASRQRSVRVPSSVLRGDARTVTINEAFDLPRAPVVLRIGATSSVLKGAGTVSLSVDVPRYQSRSPALSPLVLGLGDRSWPPPGSAAGGLPFQPSTVRRFPRNSRVQVFARGFGLTSDAVREAPVFSVISDGVALRTFPATSIPAPAGQTGTDFSASIPQDGLDPGTYAISLVVATADGKTITQAVRIELE